MSSIKKKFYRAGKPFIAVLTGYTAVKEENNFPHVQLPIQ